jgi:phosphoglycerate dehydrogenase-like enzyme
MSGEETPLKVYVENYNRDPQYSISREQVEQCLAAVGVTGEITLAWHEEPQLKALADAQCLVAPRFNAPLIAQHGKSLKLVHCINAGVERYMPLDWLPASAVLTNSSGIHAAKAAEYGLMALLMLNARMPRFATDQRGQQWQPVFTTPMAGKRAVIVGTGGVGSAVAQAARGAALHVTGVSRSGAAVEGFDAVVGSLELDAVLAEADFVVLACPLTDETRGLMSRTRLASLKPGCGIVNMARGGVVDYAAMADLLASGHLSGCVADVFDPEPLPADSFLWTTPGFCVTPHISCDSPAGYVEAGLAIFGSNVQRFLQGRELLNAVDARRQY